MKENKMGSVHVHDMYKAKYPEEYAEKFPQKKKEPDNLSPSERLRLDELKKEEEEIMQKPRPRGTGPRSRSRLKKEEEKE